MLISDILSDDNFLTSSGYFLLDAIQFARNQGSWSKTLF